MSQIINSQKPIDEILYDLINQEKFDIIEQIILCDDKFDVNILVNGEPILYYTIKNISIVKCLINLGLNINIRDCMGKTALHYAAIHNAGIDVFKLLLNKGSYVSFVIRELFDPYVIHYVAKNKQGIDIIDLLIENGADIHAVDSIGRTVLHYAVGTSLDMMKHLVNKGANIYAVTSDICYRGIDGETRRQTVLHAAAKINGECHDDLNIISFLLDNGSNIHALDSYGMKAIHYAVRNKFKKNFKSKKNIVELLIDRGANQNDIDKSLFIACKYQNDSTLEIIKLLIEKGGNINIKNSHGCTLLHAASVAYNGNILVVSYLLNNMTDINALYEDYTVYHFAIASNNKEIAELLLSDYRTKRKRPKNKKYGIIYDSILKSITKRRNQARFRGLIRAAIVFRRMRLQASRKVYAIGGSGYLAAAGNFKSIQLNMTNI